MTLTESERKLLSDIIEELVTRRMTQVQEEILNSLLAESKTWKQISLLFNVRSSGPERDTEMLKDVWAQVYTRASGEVFICNEDFRRAIRGF